MIGSLGLRAVHGCVPAFRAFATHQASAIFRFDKPCDLIRQGSAIRQSLLDSGRVTLIPQTDDVETLLAAGRCFGKIQDHSQADLEGAVAIRSGGVKGLNKEVFSDLAFSPHSDGTYLDGITVRGDKTYQVGPPKMVALQCVTPAEKGGQNLFVDGKALLSTLIQQDPHMLPTLFSRHAVNVYRGEHLVMNMPVFDRLSNGNFALRFSFDRDLYAQSAVYRVLEEFNKKYILNPLFTTHQTLSEREILVFDNHRLLHGRTAVSGVRMFRRIWIQDESVSSKLMRCEEEGTAFYPSPQGPLTLNKYQAFMGIENAQMEKIAVPTGIHLPGKLRQVLRSKIVSTIA